jgi:hypothetical protein
MGHIFTKQYPEYDAKYSVSHVLHGAAICALQSNFLLGYAVAYQCGQYVCGIRLYIPDRVVKRGHTLKHLVNKASEYMFGYAVTRGVMMYLI